MKTIYIVLTHTGTVLSKIIRYYTHDEFSHVSISLDKELNELYSFGRLNEYNPFWGGFVHEGLDRGTFKRFKNTKTEIYSMNVSEEQYNKIKKTIEFVKNYKKSYTFNMIGLLAVSIDKKIQQKHSFYCAEFIKYLLDKAKIKNNLPLLVKPENFKNIENIVKEYEGKLSNYKTEHIETYGISAFENAS